MFHNVAKVVLCAEEVPAVGFVSRELQPTACTLCAHIKLRASFTFNRIVFNTKAYSEHVEHSENTSLISLLYYHKVPIHKVPTSNHQMRPVWHMRHRLATPALEFRRKLNVSVSSFVESKL